MQEVSLETMHRALIMRVTHIQEAARTRMQPVYTKPYDICVQLYVRTCIAQVKNVVHVAPMSDGNVSYPRRASLDVTSVS